MFVSFFFYPFENLSKEEGGRSGEILISKSEIINKPEILNLS